MIAAGCIFSSCSDRTVATTDQYPNDGTEATADDAGVADAGTDTDMDTGIDAEADKELDREDVVNTGEEIDMERMGNVDRADAALETMPANTRQLVMPVREMMERMRNQQMSGDVDRDFALLMIEHHKGAIDMSNQVLQSGDNAEITERARLLVQTKQQEIDKLQTFQTVREIITLKLQQQKQLQQLYRAQTADKLYLF